MQKPSQHRRRAATGTMGAGASTIADYKEAASKSDESSFPEAFAQLKTSVEAFEGDADAADEAQTAADVAVVTLGVRFDTVSYSDFAGNFRLSPTCKGSFSAVPKPIFATKYSFCSIFRDLQDSQTFAPLQIQNLLNFCNCLQFFGNFSRFLQTFAEIC